MAQVSTATDHDRRASQPWSHRRPGAAPSGAAPVPAPRLLKVRGRRVRARRAGACWSSWRSPRPCHRAVRARTSQDLLATLQKPPSAAHLFGTDDLGRDVLVAGDLRLAGLARGRADLDRRGAVARRAGRADGRLRRRPHRRRPDAGDGRDLGVPVADPGAGDHGGARAPASATR